MKNKKRDVIKHCFDVKGMHTLEVNGVRGEFTLYEAPAFDKNKRYMALTEFYADEEQYFALTKVKGPLQLKSVLLKKDYDQLHIYLEQDVDNGWEIEIVKQVHPRKRKKAR
jgi:hypothetical protein